jgi:hypothetical protein
MSSIQINPVNLESCPIASFTVRVTTSVNVLAAPGVGWRWGVNMAHLHVITAEASDDLKVADEDGSNELAHIHSATAGVNVTVDYHRGVFLLPENKALKAVSTMATGVILVTGTAFKIKVV